MYESFLTDLDTIFFQRLSAFSFFLDLGQQFIKKLSIANIYI